MPEKELPARPNLEQYKKQAKDLAHDCRAGDPGCAGARRAIILASAVLARTCHRASRLTDAQLVLAREHGFESWPKFAAHITTVNLERSVAEIADPVAAFITRCIRAARRSHTSGTLEEAELILVALPARRTGQHLHRRHPRR